MNYLRRRERRKLIDLEEDIQQQQYQSFINNFKESDSDEDDRYRNYQQRHKEYCLVKIIYRSPNTRQRRKIDEIMIIQHNRTVFKGCLRDGDQFTFKSKRYRNESRIKLKFYINDFIEEEMIGCCEHGLINRNRPEHLFQIEKVIGAKPCYDCQFNDDILSERSSSNSRRNSFQKNQISSSNILSEDRSYEEKATEKNSTRTIPQTTNNKRSSEGFSGDATELSNLPNDEDSTDVLPSLRESTLQRTYGPPQLSVVETPSPNVRQLTPSGILFNSTTTTTTTQQRTTIRSNSNESTQIEINSNERTTAPNNIAFAQDATQLLLARLGIIRQEQVERPDVVRIIPPREKGNVEYFILVYLHDFYPDESIVKHLRSLVNFLKIFNDVDDCIAFINNIENEKIILILSDSFHDSILPRIEELQQIFTIYILLENNNNNQLDLSSENSKIQSISNNINHIYEQISNHINKMTRDLIIYLNISSNATSIEPTMLYSLLLIEIILDKTEAKSDLKEMINFVRQEYEGNDEELKIIDEFENEYQKNDAIYWFCRSCFISKMLNKALHIPSPDILFRFRLFIQDLFQQIQDESTSESITVYLGQTIERNDLDNLQNNILNNDILIFPQILSGSTDQQRAIRIAKEIPLINENMIPLIIRIDISENFKCAILNSIDEDHNVLLNMGIMGHLIQIEKENIHEDQIASIHVRLFKPEEQENIQQILEKTRTEVKGSSSFVGMIKLMIQINQQAAAEQLIQTMVDDEILKLDLKFQGPIATGCLIVAQSYRAKEDYKHALDLFLLSIKVFHRMISPNAVELAPIYSNIALMYFRLENYEKSLEYYQITLDAQLHSSTPDLFSISVVTKSLGLIYSKQKNYPEAIKYLERTLKILQQCSEPHDSEMASTYDDLGDIYLVQSKYNEALENYTKQLEIEERILPQNLQTLGTSYNTIGNIYLKIGQSKEALAYLKRGLESFQQILPLTHPTFASLYNNIGLMYYREEEYDDALRCYSKTLEIAAISLPENHSLVGVTLFNMGLLYSNQGKFDEAIECIEKSTEQFLKTLPPDHADVVTNKKHIETIRQKKVLKDIFNENIID